jgi:hypothetical protein
VSHGQGLCAKHGQQKNLKNTFFVYLNERNVCC